MEYLIICGFIIIIPIVLFVVLARGIFRIEAIVSRLMSISESTARSATAQETATAHLARIDFFLEKQYERFNRNG